MNYIENYFKNAKIGDKVVDIILDEEGIIEDTEYYAEYPLKVVFNDGYYKYYTADGRENKRDKVQRLFYKDYEPEIEIPEPPKREFELTLEKYRVNPVNISQNHNTGLNSGATEKYIKAGRFRKTKEGAEQALKLQTRIMRLHALAEQLGGLKEWRKEEENFYIYKGLGDNKWLSDYQAMCYSPETVYMTKECAERICEMLNNDEFSLEVEDE